MKTTFGPTLIVLLFLCCGCALAQTDTGTGDTGTPVQPGPKPAFTYPDALPSLDFLNAAVENSSITLGIGAGVTYLSNTYGLNSNQDRVVTQITPSIRIQQFRPRLSWNIGYAGGWQHYAQVNGVSGPNNNNNLFSQNVSAGFLWQIAQHWQLSARNHFVYSANPFDSYISSTGTPTMNNPNPVAYYPVTQFTLNNAIMSLTHQLSKVDTLSFTGTSDLRQTSNYNLVTAAPFYNLVSYGGLASYSHRLNPKLSLGAAYDYNSLDFGRGQQRSGIQTISMTVDYLIRPNMTISGWIGPTYTSTKTTISIPIYLVQYNSLWSTSGGVNFGWQGLRNSFRAGYSRRVLDGGGYIATSQVNALHAAYARMLTSKLNASVGAGYFHNVSTTLSARTYNYGSINASLTYKLARSLSATAQYSYLRQNPPNAILVPNISRNVYSDNLVGVSISYTWSHPLGR